MNDPGEKVYVVYREYKGSVEMFGIYDVGHRDAAETLAGKVGGRAGEMSLNPFAEQIRQGLLPMSVYLYRSGDRADVDVGSGAMDSQEIGSVREEPGEYGTRYCVKVLVRTQPEAIESARRLLDRYLQHIDKAKADFLREQANA